MIPKIEVDSFENLVVMLKFHTPGLITVHGSVNNSRPGVIASREPTNLVIVEFDKLSKEDAESFSVYNDIVCNGETLLHYKRVCLGIEQEQALEPESRVLNFLTQSFEGATVLTSASIASVDSAAVSPSTSAANL